MKLEIWRGICEGGKELCSCNELLIEEWNGMCTKRTKRIMPAERPFWHWQIDKGNEMPFEEKYWKTGWLLSINNQNMINTDNNNNEYDKEDQTLPFQRLQKYIAWFVIVCEPRKGKAQRKDTHTRDRPKAVNMNLRNAENKWNHWMGDNAHCPT